VTFQLGPASWLAGMELNTFFFSTPLLLILRIQYFEKSWMTTSLARHLPIDSNPVWNGDTVSSTIRTPTALHIQTRQDGPFGPRWIDDDCLVPERCRNDDSVFSFNSRGFRLLRVLATKVCRSPCRSLYWSCCPLPFWTMACCCKERL
jgi:hypothetical protein